MYFTEYEFSLTPEENQVMMMMMTIVMTNMIVLMMMTIVMTRMKMMVMIIVMTKMKLMVTMIGPTGCLLRAGIAHKKLATTRWQGW